MNNTRQSQKTFRMLEHALWNTVHRIQVQHSETSKNLAHTCLTAPNSEYFRSRGCRSEHKQPEGLSISIWNSYVALEFELTAGKDEKADSVSAFYRVPGKTTEGDVFEKSDGYVKVEDFKSVFSGCLPDCASAWPPSAAEGEMAELETMEMLWCYVTTHLLNVNELHSDTINDPADFLKLWEARFNSKFFDVLENDDTSLKIGNDLVRVTATICGEASISLQVDLQLVGKVVTVGGTLAGLTTSRHQIYPFLYRIRPRKRDLDQAISD